MLFMYHSPVRASSATAGISMQARHIIRNREISFFIVYRSFFTF